MRYAPIRPFRDLRTGRSAPYGASFTPAFGNAYPAIEITVPANHVTSRFGGLAFRITP
jgi:hypothetical protein